MSPRRLTRAQAIGAGAAAAAAAAVGARELSRGAAGPALHPAKHRYTADFGGEGAGWGAGWAALHDRRVSRVGGAAVFAVPTGLAGTAPAQPMPVYVLDRECGECEQLATFTATNATLRPGLLLHRTGPFEFLGVTAEHGELVLAAYGRERRTVHARAAAVHIPAGTAANMRVRLRGGRLQATLWRDGNAEPAPQLAAHVAGGHGGCGVVLVHPTNLRACRLELRRYELGADEPFGPTPPAAVVTMSGIPQPDAGGQLHVLARVWSAFAARATIEWSDEPGFTGASAAPAADLTAPPYTHAVKIPVEPGRPRYWRAVLRSVTSGAVTRTDPQQARAHHPADPLVLLAASCAQLTGPPPNAGYTRLLEAAPHTPAALVYQGDIGYPNNTADACYGEGPDFFADRFGRTLAEPTWADLRRSVPNGFTLDDHDYGPVNNADRTTVEAWAWGLWNRIHADPTPIGYFDFRMGDVHCLTLDGRRYCDPVTAPNTPAKTKLGRTQFGWMQHILETSDAGMFVLFSADIFATRANPRNHKRVDDCFIYGWPDEYRRAMTLFMDVQLSGRRVLVVSGDAHSLRVHYHPDPLRRAAAARLSIVEVICSGIRAQLWSGADTPDPTLDPRRYVLNRSGGGVIEVDPPGTAGRAVTLRAIDVDAARPADAFPPLRITFPPGDDRVAAGV